MLNRKLQYITERLGWLNLSYSAQTVLSSAEPHGLFGGIFATFFKRNFLNSFWERFCVEVPPKRFSVPHVQYMVTNRSDSRQARFKGQQSHWNDELYRTCTWREFLNLFGEPFLHQPPSWPNG